LAAAALLLGTLPALAETAPPPRLALVIGNAAYAEAQPLPACAASAHLAAQALEAEGYAVTLRQDLSHGQMVAALGSFGRALAMAPGARAVAYVCARAVAFEGRAFLLPVTAHVQKPGDAISQGLLATRLTAALDQPGGGEALVLVDAIPGPAGDAATWLAALREAGSRVRAAISLPTAAPETGPAPLASSFSTLIPQGQVPLEGALAALRQQTGRFPGLALALHMPEPAMPPPADPPPLAALQPPAIVEPPAMEPAVPAPPVEAPAPRGAPPAAAPTPPAPSPLTTAAPEPPTNLAQRRFIQAVLRRLGYYDGPLDGAFGPGARTAIRRYQRETGMAPTGLLTPDQVRRLLSTQRAGAV
jgi:hypothetical protein